MTFTKQQTDALNAPLDRRHVKQREQAGRKLSYIEGWQAISEANRIFGFGEWSSETVEIRCVAETARKVGRQQRDGHSVSYIARVRVTVSADGKAVTREGVGSGHGMDVDLGLAHESALKESETDARKRALMTFGNPFGLALYDKDQANVVDVPTGPAPMSVDHMLHEIGACADDEAMLRLKKDPAFRAGYKAADELSRKRIEQALAKAAEEAAA